MVYQVAPTPGRPGTPWEGTLTQLHHGWEYELIHQGNMFFMSYCQSFLVN